MGGGVAPPAGERADDPQLLPFGRNLRKDLLLLAKAHTSGSWRILDGSEEGRVAGVLPPAPVFAALPAPKTGGTVRIEIGGAVVEIDPGADMAVVTSVLRLLAGQC